MTLCPKWVLRREKSVPQFLAGKYLSNQPGDFASPHLGRWEPCW